jgi:DNA-directed RNA polymerase subunit RPC12/RpoP
MKVIEKGPSKYWWVGKRGTCLNCKSIVEIEEGDYTKLVYPAGNMKQIAIPCQVCGALIILGTATELKPEAPPLTSVVPTVPPARTDVTSLVSVGDIDGESLPLTKCVCGEPFGYWDQVISIYPEHPWACPKCGVRLIFSTGIRIFKIE